jgi:chitinase
MVNEYNADGVDIDWEYPGQSGASGNVISASDSANLLTFLALLRSKFGNDKIISLATPTNVWLGSDGQPLADVSSYAKYIDHVLIMNYDVWGASANPGPNAPYNTCSGSWQPGANAVAAVDAWKKAGMPANKIMLGLPSYGYVSDSTATTLIHKRSRQMEAMHARQIAAEARSKMHDGNLRPQFIDAENESEKRDLEKRQSTAGDISSFKNSQIQFNQLVSYKVLSLSTTGVWYGKNGYTRKWDDCSSTPYAYNQDRSTVVTYDDPTSLKIKAQFAREQGLAGTGMWDISGDTADWVLVKATRSGLGI